MGAWGALAFDNDDANDWAYDLDDHNDLSLVEDAFSDVVGPTVYLEAPTACNALAACEVLARLNGKPGYKNAYTEKVDQWVAKHKLDVPDKLLNRANAVIDRILGKDSELNELWADDKADWLAAVENLRQRLQK